MSKNILKIKTKHNGTENTQVGYVMTCLPLFPTEVRR